MSSVVASTLTSPSSGSSSIHPTSSSKDVVRVVCASVFGFLCFVAILSLFLCSCWCKKRNRRAGTTPTGNSCLENAMSGFRTLTFPPQPTVDPMNRPPPPPRSRSEVPQHGYQLSDLPPRGPRASSRFSTYNQRLPVYSEHPPIESAVEQPL
ncbi:hypothetical protein JAAARDRAFT_29994 [Jaapia argillacea MUCL 33604]|uniref:Uncharacterized protein n=1 Tax=Jaapia argillacea MUCL 33604 TaxID=933084 RepID=A0A067Q4V9_9AGAM|nr:hypothetical protein JAAARDRAFT_29994 [Jaapia argillacea MUCL 33604]